MRLASARAGRLVAPLGCLLLTASGLLAAQERTAADTITWNALGTREGWCVEFLMEPKDAADDLTRGYHVVPARSVGWLLPAMSRLIADEPTYADWVPSQLCTYVSDAVTVENRRFDRGDGGQPIAVLYWGVAAARDDGSATGDLVSLREFGTNSSSVQQNMGTRGVPIDRIQFEVHPAPEGTDRDYMVKLSGAQVFYTTGEPRVDSTGTATERASVGVMNGNNRAVWTVRLSYTPVSMGTTSGALRVVGKRGLAKALNKSPIRLVGPVVVGGSGQVVLHR